MNIWAETRKRKKKLLTNFIHPCTDSISMCYPNIQSREKIKDYWTYLKHFIYNYDIKQVKRNKPKELPFIIFPTLLPHSPII